MHIFRGPIRVCLHNNCPLLGRIAEVEGAAYEKRIKRLLLQLSWPWLLPVESLQSAVNFGHPMGEHAMALKPKVFVSRIIPEVGLNKIKAHCDAEVWTDPLPPP